MPVWYDALQSLTVLSDYLECKIRSEYPGNHLYVKSGGTYLFFVEVADIFDADTELAQLKEGTTLEEKVRSKADELSVEFKKLVTLKSEETCGGKTTGGDPKGSETEVKDSGERKVEEIEKVSGKREESMREDPKEDLKHPENTEGNLVEGKSAQDLLETDSQANKEQKEEVEGEDIPQRTFTKRAGDADNLVAWLGVETLLRDMGVKRGSLEGDGNFHAFTLNVVYHPLFQRHLRKWQATEEEAK